VTRITRGAPPDAEVPHMQKRRIGASRSGRIFTSIPVEVRVNGRAAEGTVRNASDGGMFVETRAIPMQGESVTLRFLQRSVSSVEVKGLVWWTTEGSSFRHRYRGFGFRLLEDDKRYSAMLASLQPVSPTESAQQRLRAAVAASGGIPGSGRSPRSR
jgi:PilZ domain